MWQLDWAVEPVDHSSERPPQPLDASAAVDAACVARVGGLMWEDHCHECATPDCYQTCPLYARRPDGKCARLEYGIYPNDAFSGLFPFGADVRFRRWGKLESPIPVGPLPRWMAPRLVRLDHALSAGAKRIDSLRRPAVRRRATSAYGYGRLNLLRAAPTDDFDDFVLEAWSPEDKEFRLAIECKHDGVSYFRESVAIRPGWNRATFPAAALLAAATGRDSRILVYPEADATVRIVFTWLDFVRYRRSPTPAVAPAAVSTAAGGPAATVKCVVWDLDGTLWDGILADLGPDSLTPTAAARRLIEDLDARGIIQSVASKNDFDEAWKVLTRLELDQMFLYPSIHWGPKSESIRQIATSLNIGLDSIAFVDDSAVERAQVRDALPQVRVYDVTDIPQLLMFDEFDVRPSEEGRRRRLSYLSEMERQQNLARSSDVSIDEFLRSCELRVDLFVPGDDAGLERCHELLLRSNQLNLSTRRYSRQELDDLVADPTRVPLAVSVRDRFGDYGLVGFVTVGMDVDRRIWVEDLVLSCRVAKKTIENAVLEAIRLLTADEAAGIAMRFLPTPRNGPLLEALRATGAVVAGPDAAGTLLLELDVRRAVASSDVVSEVDVDPSAERRLLDLASAAVS